MKPSRAPRAAGSPYSSHSNVIPSRRTGRYNSGEVSMATNRREFLLSGAALAQPPERKVRIGIVGGRFGATFYFHEHPDCVVEAVSDLRADRRAVLMKTYRCAKSYQSLEKLLLDKNIDAVFLATPAPDHLRHVTMTLAAGKHVLSAVPAVIGTLEDCRKLVDAVSRSGRNYM